MSNEKVKIIGLELENVKRVSALKMSPEASGLTIIGGDNGQGKTSVLDAICFALGGERYRPSNLKKEDGIADPYIKLTLSNGLVVERKGKNAALKVTDPSGKKSGQTILDSFIEELALDLPKFIQANGKKKAETLLAVLGLGEVLGKLDMEEQKLFTERTATGQFADRKQKFAAELAWFDGVPDVPVTASELLEQHKAVLAKNAENQRCRQNLDELRGKASNLTGRICDLKQALAETEASLAKVNSEIKSGESVTLTDTPTDELEKQLDVIEETNAKVRANLDKTRATSEARAAKEEYDVLTAKLEEVRSQRMKLLEGAKMPLPGLSVQDSELVLNGKKWDCMSGAEQLRAGTAIVRMLNPKCGFVLLDRLEAMDLKTVSEFGAWLEAEGLQAIATRVSRGDECSIVIEDGRVLGAECTAVKHNEIELSDDEGF